MWPQFHESLFWGQSEMSSPYSTGVMRKIYNVKKSEALARNYVFVGITFPPCKFVFSIALNKEGFAQEKNENHHKYS